MTRPPTRIKFYDQDDNLLGELWTHEPSETNVAHAVIWDLMVNRRIQGDQLRYLIDLIENEREANGRNAEPDRSHLDTYRRGL